MTSIPPSATTRAGLDLTARLPAVVAWDAPRGQLVILDQTRLPGEVHRLRCGTVAEVRRAIRRLSVRGAPAIGIAAAYGVCLAAQPAADGRGTGSVRERCLQAIDQLASSRPTAVNLFWALERMRGVLQRCQDETGLAAALLAEAESIHQQDRQLGAAIGRYGQAVLQQPLRRWCAEHGPDATPGVLTHCNAGALATGGAGTALAPLYELWQQGQTLRVYADETRPLLQGARLTAWELQQAGLPVTVIADAMAAMLLRSGRIAAVIVGADRIAASGDVANKIGTYGLAVLARHHDVPFFVAAPSSTFDMELADGAEIPIEQRDGDEFSMHFTRPPLPPNCDVFNPAFDVTPAELVTAIITDRGVIESPTTAAVSAVLTPVGAAQEGS